MTNKYLINDQVTAAAGLRREVEADSYRLVDGYFHFFTGDRSNGLETVFSMSADKVQAIELVKN